MPIKPNQDVTASFLPGLGDQHVVGAAGIGLQVVDATLGCNSNYTAAQLLASPPNTGAALAAGPVVHSFGVAPTAYWAMPLDNSVAGISYTAITADNSAVYIMPRTYTGGATMPVGVRTRVFIQR